MTTIWFTDRDGQLLFTCSLKVYFTSITSYYYCDGDQGLPKLRSYNIIMLYLISNFYQLTSSYSCVDVASVSKQLQLLYRIITAVLFHVAKQSI